MTVPFLSYIQEDCYIEIQKYIFGKIQDYNTAIPPQENCQCAAIAPQENCQCAGIQLNEVIDKKFSHSFNYALLNKVQCVLIIERTIIKAILVTCYRHRFFLGLSHLKSLRSTYIPIILPLELTTLIFHFLWFWLFHESMQ